MVTGRLGRSRPHFYGEPGQTRRKTNEGQAVTCDHLVGRMRPFPLPSASRARLGVSSGRSATLLPPLSCSVCAKTAVRMLHPVSGSTWLQVAPGISGRGLLPTLMGGLGTAPYL